MRIFYKPIFTSEKHINCVGGCAHCTATGEITGCEDHDSNWMFCTNCYEWAEVTCPKKYFMKEEDK